MKDNSGHERFMYIVKNQKIVVVYKLSLEALNTAFKHNWTKFGNDLCMYLVDKVILHT